MQRMSASFRARVTLPGSASSQGQGPRACLADYSKYQVAGTQPPTFCPDNHQTSRISHHRTSFYCLGWLGIYRRPRRNPLFPYFHPHYFAISYDRPMPSVILLSNACS